MIVFTATSARQLACGWYAEAVLWWTPQSTGGVGGELWAAVRRQCVWDSECGESFPEGLDEPGGSFPGGCDYWPIRVTVHEDKVCVPLVVEEVCCDVLTMGIAGWEGALLLQVAWN